MNITAINFDYKDIEELKKLYSYNIFEGSIGNKYELHYGLHNSVIRIPFQINLPKNLQESDIHFVDLDCKYSDWNDELEITNLTNYHSFRCCYPQTSLDERPIGFTKLVERILSSLRRKMLIIFQGSNVFQKYELINAHDQSAKEELDLYASFTGADVYRGTIEGTSVHLFTDTEPTLKSFLKKYINDFKYFMYLHNHDSNIIPLIANNEKRVVAFYEKRHNVDIFVLPQVESKASFIHDFLTQVAPHYAPELFPHLSTNNWLEDERYYLPNHSNILDKKEEIKQQYLAEIEKFDKELQKNRQKFSFLHELLTEDSDTLVKATIKFLKWLEFETVIDADSLNNDLDEDIQIHTKEPVTENEIKLLLIEVKGIGGTSKDSECNQIDKHVKRRGRERNAYDVQGMYIVNHQKHLPPHKREKVPFSKNQITDAENSERGLLTTHQLYNLYYDIENNIITKEEAKLLEYWT